MNISKIGSKASHHFSTIHTLRATSLLNVVECNLIMFTSTPLVPFPLDTKLVCINLVHVLHTFERKFGTLCSMYV